VLRYAAENKHLNESLRDFIKRRGGINECAARFARRATSPQKDNKKKTEVGNGAASRCSPPKTRFTVRR
jgi:hypothetical protein